MDKYLDNAEARSSCLSSVNSYWASVYGQPAYGSVPVTTTLGVQMMTGGNAPAIPLPQTTVLTPTPNGGFVGRTF